MPLAARSAYDAMTTVASLESTLAEAECSTCGRKTVRVLAEGRCEGARMWRWDCMCGAYTEPVSDDSVTEMLAADAAADQHAAVYRAACDTLDKVEVLGHHSVAHPISVRSKNYPVTLELGDALNALLARSAEVDPPIYDEVLNDVVLYMDGRKEPLASKMRYALQVLSGALFATRFDDSRPSESEQDAMLEAVRRVALSASDQPLVDSCAGWGCEPDLYGPPLVGPGGGDAPTWRQYCDRCIDKHGDSHLQQRRDLVRSMHAHWATAHHEADWAINNPASNTARWLRGVQIPSSPTTPGGCDMEN